MKPDKIFLRGVLFLLIFVLPARAVMLPSHYAHMAEESKIKAVALVESVEVIKKGKHNSEKKVTFRLRHSFVENVPETFSGVCYSVDYEWQEPLMGGTIYCYPNKGDLVYVTIGGDGGFITSWTYLNGVTEGMFIDNRDKIRYGMGNAWLDL